MCSFIQKRRHVSTVLAVELSKQTWYNAIIPLTLQNNQTGSLPSITHIRFQHVVSVAYDSLICVHYFLLNCNVHFYKSKFLLTLVQPRVDLDQLTTVTEC